jgi:hypothetical protein
LAAAAEVWRHHSVSGSSRAAGAVLPPRAATVATKSPAATAMAGALPTIKNQLNEAAAMAMETTTTVDAETIFPSLNSQNYIEFRDNIKVMATF